MSNTESDSLLSSREGTLSSLPRSMALFIIGTSEDKLYDPEADAQVVQTQPFVVAFLILTVVSVTFLSTTLAGLTILSEYSTIPRRFLAIALGFAVSALVWTVYRLVLDAAENRRRAKSGLIHSVFWIPMFILLLSLGLVFSGPILTKLVEGELERLERETRFINIYNAQAERLQIGRSESLYNHIQSFALNQRASELLIPNFECLDLIRQSELIRTLSTDEAFSAAESCRTEISSFEDLAASGKISEDEKFSSWAGDWNNSVLRNYYTQQIRDHKAELNDFLRGFHERGIIHSISQSLLHFPEVSLALGMMFGLVFTFPVFTHLLSNPSAQAFSRAEAWRLSLSRDHDIHLDAYRIMSPSGTPEPVNFYSTPGLVLKRELEILGVSSARSGKEHSK